ncbi:lysophospholipid acyltransferase family protein [Actinomycetota bacterium]
MERFEPIYHPIVGVARTLFRAQGTRFTILGEDNVPREGGAVMAINHIGYLDFVYAGLSARKAHRLVRFMAKKSIWEHKVAGPLMRSMRHIPVDRHAGAGSFREAVEALKAGEIVGVFPEATMSLSFELKPFKSGAVRMAQAAGVPILPTTLWGVQRVWTKHLPKQMGRKHIPIHITVGEPIPVPKDADAESVNRHLFEVMHAQLEAQRAAYGPFPAEDAAYLPRSMGGTAPTPEEALAKEEHDRTRLKDKFNS